MHQYYVLLKCTSRGGRTCIIITSHVYVWGVITNLFPTPVTCDCRVGADYKLMIMILITPDYADVIMMITHQKL